VKFSDQDWHVERASSGTYIALDASEEDRDVFVDSLLTSGIGVTKYGASFRPASNGVMYKWYITVSVKNLTPDEVSKALSNQISKKSPPLAILRELEVKGVNVEWKASNLYFSDEINDLDPNLKTAAENNAEAIIEILIYRGLPELSASQQSKTENSPPTGGSRSVGNSSDELILSEKRIAEQILKILIPEIRRTEKNEEESAQQPSDESVKVFSQLNGRVANIEAIIKRSEDSDHSSKQLLEINEDLKKMLEMQDYSTEFFSQFIEKLSNIETIAKSDHSSKQLITMNEELTQQLAEAVQYVDYADEQLKEKNRSRNDPEEQANTDFKLALPVYEPPSSKTPDPQLLEIMLKAFTPKINYLANSLDQLMSFKQMWHESDSKYAINQLQQISDQTIDNMSPRPKSIRIPKSNKRRGWRETHVKNGAKGLRMGRLYFRIREDTHVDVIIDIKLNQNNNYRFIDQLPIVQG